MKHLRLAAAAGAVILLTACGSSGGGSGSSSTSSSLPSPKIRVISSWEQEPSPLNSYATYFRIILMDGAICILESENVDHDAISSVLVPSSECGLTTPTHSPTAS